MNGLSTLFGNCRHVKIIESLLDNWDYDFSRADIARISGLHKSTTNRLISKLKKSGIVKDTGKKEGKAHLYKLNFENKQAQLLIQLRNTIISNGLRERIVELGETPLYDLMIDQNPIATSHNKFNKLVNRDKKQITVQSDLSLASQEIGPKMPNAYDDNLNFRGYQ